jgi:hypothetical protein
MPSQGRETESSPPRARRWALGHCRGLPGVVCRASADRASPQGRPNPVKPNPEKSVRGEEPNPTWALSPQDTHLMSQRDELEFQGGAARSRKPSMETTVERIMIMPATVGRWRKKSLAFLGPSEF